MTKRYGEHAALGPIDLTVDAAKTLCLLGPSGCGKSTLLRAVIGLVRPDAGEVRLGDTAVTPETVRALRQRMGYVIQEGGLFPHLTSRENVSLMARHLGWEGGRVRARVAELAALVRLPEGLLDRHPQALSGGQRQRVGLMRALMLDPEVVLLDEPLGALDPMVRADLQRDLREIFQTLRRTVLMVSHDLREARVLADEVCLLRDGRVVQRGTVDALEHAPEDEFVTRFFGAWR
ncbi:MAG: ATP-binding cassette domain-containing protein [Polyangiales bacterium]